jgi:hypothetical protein
VQLVSASPVKSICSGMPTSWTASLACDASAAMTSRWAGPSSARQVAAASSYRAHQSPLWILGVEGMVGL